MHVLLFILIAATSPKVEIVRPEAYAVKRFAEVVEAAEDQEEASDQEKLISDRAHLVIAARKLAELEAISKTDARPEPKPEIVELRIKAARAEVDHYQHQVARLEKKILKVKRHERKPEKTKASPKTKSLKSGL